MTVVVSRAMVPAVIAPVRILPLTTGRSPYDPTDLLKLYLYGYFYRIRSSRRLTSDFRTIAEFHRRNGKAFVAVCRAFVQFCRQAKPISGELVAIDGSKFQACEDRRITAYVPANRAANNQGEQPHFDRTQFVYEAEHDRYRCPHQQELTRKQVNRGSVVYAAQRFVTRHAHEAAFERMEQRLATHPDIMIKRRCIVEHPFGNLKQWIFGNGRFLLRGLEGAGSEMALGVTVYNLKRAIAVPGIGKMMALLA